MADNPKMVKIYDPFRNAFCKVPIDQAKKLVEQCEKIKAAIEKAEKEDK